jgi:hypothetical protein
MASQAKMDMMVSREKRENQVPIGMFCLCDPLLSRGNCSKIGVE